MGTSFSLFRSVQFGVLLVVIYYVALFDNGDQIDKEINIVRHNILKQKQELKKIIKEKTNLQKYAKAFEDVSINTGTKVLEALGKGFEENNFSAFLTDTARQLNMSGHDIGRPVSSQEKKWRVQKVQMSLEGSYSNLMQFIVNIQNYKYIVTLNKNTMRVLGDASDKNKKIKADLSIKSYQYAQETKN